MAEFSRLVITNKGQALLAKMMTGEADVKFTKISVSDKEYTLEELNMLTELTGVKQTAPVAKITRTNNVAITIETSFDNTELTQGYYMRALGLYAIDPDDGEILYAVTTELARCCYMPAYNGITVSGACIKLVTTVGNAENVSLEVDPGVYATVGEIKELRDSIGNLKPVATSGDYNDLSNRPSIPAAVRVKGNAESSYRTGDVNLTAENIGAFSKESDGYIRANGIRTDRGFLGMTTDSAGQGLTICSDEVYPNSNGKMRLGVPTKRFSKIYLRGSWDDSSNGMGDTEYGARKIDVIANDPPSFAINIWYRDKSDNTGVFISSSSFEPATNNRLSLGDSYAKWSQLYATNGTIQTSDRNQKNTIEELLEEKAKAFIYGLKPSTYKMNTGTSNRIHWGLISQDIEELFEKIGITSIDFAGFIKSPKIQRITVDENGNKLQKPIEKVIEGEYDYSLRYDEFIAPIIKVIQSQHEEIEILKQETAVLKRQLSELMKRETV